MAKHSNITDQKSKNDPSTQIKAVKKTAKQKQQKKIADKEKEPIRKIPASSMG